MCYSCGHAEGAEYLGHECNLTQEISSGDSVSLKRPLAPKRTFAERLKAKMRSKANREATKQEQHQYAKEFKAAKIAEFISWAKENRVFDFVDMRKTFVKNFVTGRWVLTIKRDKDGNFLKVKARWVLRGFLDKQQSDLQTDSPTSTRPGFRLQCQIAANDKHVPCRVRAGWRQAMAATWYFLATMLE